MLLAAFVYHLTLYSMLYVYTMFINLKCLRGWVWKFQTRFGWLNPIHSMRIGLGYYITIYTWTNSKQQKILIVIMLLETVCIGIEMDGALSCDLIFIGVVNFGLLYMWLGFQVLSFSSILFIQIYDGYMNKY